MDKLEIRKAWERYTEKNDFILNPNTEIVDSVIEGVLENEKKHGLKLCPCRLRDGSRERDLELLCPCNFKIQETWTNKGECWCSLFVKRKEYPENNTVDEDSEQFQ